MKSCTKHRADAVAGPGTAVRPCGGGVCQGDEYEGKGGGGVKLRMAIDYSISYPYIVASVCIFVCMDGTPSFPTSINKQHSSKVYHMLQKCLFFWMKKKRIPIKILEVTNKKT